MRNICLHTLLIIATGIIIYSNTLSGPFIWDDYWLILDNPHIRELSNFTDISGTRYLAYLSFAINYKIHGYSVAGYHIFNIAVHIINSVLVYFLIMLIFRSHASALSNQQSAYKISLFAGLLFVSHPVYTMAVTYITQRSILLTTFFYLLSLVMYIKARLSQLSVIAASSKALHQAVSSQQSASKRKQVFYYSASVISAVFAMKCKEIAFTLPIVILILDRCFFGRQRAFRKSIIYLIPILLTLLIIPLDRPQPEVFNPSESGAFKISDDRTLSGLHERTLSPISRKDYMLTQLRVIITYIRLFFLPVDLNLDYDYPVFSSFSNPNVLLSFLFILIILGLALYLFYTARSTLNVAPLISFGILYLLITLSIESFVIPLSYMIFEYRLYLPSIGIILALTGLLSNVEPHLRNKFRYAAAVIALVVIAFSAATYMRNNVFKNEVTLWEDVVKKSPLNAAAHNSLGNAYSDHGQIDKALQEYLTVITLNPFSFAAVLAHSNLGLIYADSGRLNEAIQEYKTALSFYDYAVVRNNLGLAYYKQGRLNDAINEYITALRLRPDYAKAHGNLADAYIDSGMPDKAIEHYQAAVKLGLNTATIHNKLGIAYRQKGLIKEALQEFEAVLEIDPTFLDAQQNIELIRK